MRRTISPSLLAPVCFLLAAGDAVAQYKPAPRFNTPVLTEDFLSDLDHEQLRILRRAIRTCPTVGRPMKNERDPCVTMGTDKAIADTKNADLITFHEALPVTARYDEQRSSNVWRVWATTP